MKIFILVSALLVLLFACNSDFIPKPKGYFKIDFPKHEYRQFNEAGFPYTFEYPTYANISKEYDSTGQQPYWINIDFPGYAGRIYISYKAVNSTSIYKIKTAIGYKDSIVKNNFEKVILAIIVISVLPMVIAFLKGKRKKSNPSTF